MDGQTGEIVRLPGHCHGGIKKTKYRTFLKLKNKTCSFYPIKSTIYNPVCIMKNFDQHYLHLCSLLVKKLDNKTKEN